MLPQIILLTLAILSLFLSIKKHGTIDPKPRDATNTLIGWLIQIALLYWGGFFDVFFR